ncbi:MAG: valine--tRNA ligase [Bacteroidota bacterium]
MISLPKAYNPQDVEDKWYAKWEELKLFHAQVNPAKKHYTIVIPPPNITGILTMGHVLNNTIQDAFVRMKRMQGFETLWMPGTDHAGIATQNVVEKSLAKEGKTRHDLGREEFLERVWKWKNAYGGTIIKQLKKLGASCDWERERFTMDDGLSEAVQEMFIRLYKKGLIYRGKYIINWCPKDHTAISDDEVEYSEQNTNLWYFKYPIKDSNEFVVVATTRPETMLGDTAIAVNPKDERYLHLLGKTVILPLVGRHIPIIADDMIDPKFGTGMVKVTPAHDPNDYWIGERHNAGIGIRNKMIPINILDISAKMNENVPEKYRGLDRFEARKTVIADLESLGLLQKTEPHIHNIGRCYRCNTVIEPYLSDQWFVKMKPLAEEAARVVLHGKIHFHPERWVKTYEHWMSNIRDWCISRQLWWGHRIPVWYCVGDDACKIECKEPIASKSKPDSCPHCGSKNLRQDEDVLDTWFSSWLWPFSTLGWPHDNPELRYFYPTHTLVTAPDIIFFWVARMIMASLEVSSEIPLPDGSKRIKDEDRIPFSDVYFTSIIRDTQGRKMSKSLGNSPDPIDVINEYGADALRFTILYLAPLGQDVLYSNEKCELGRNFANKVWNAGRFLLMNHDQLREQNPTLPNVSSNSINESHLDLADKWILSRLNSTIGELTTAMETFEINQATKILYDFVWHDYCDWYVELVKKRLYGDESPEIKIIVINRAISIFDQTLRLIHPFMPFITEELWQNLRFHKTNETIMTASFPISDVKWIDKAIEDEFGKRVIKPATVFRTLKAEHSIPPSEKPRIVLLPANDALIQVFKKYEKLITSVSGSKLTIEFTKTPISLSASGIAYDTVVFMPLDAENISAERERMQKEINHLDQMIVQTEKKLNNTSFVSKAPKDVVDNERKKLETFQQNREKLLVNLKSLG